jgi:hypothetical protein
MGLPFPLGHLARLLLFVLNLPLRRGHLLLHLDLGLGDGQVVAMLAVGLVASTVSVMATSAALTLGSAVAVFSIGGKRVFGWEQVKFHNE